MFGFTAVGAGLVTLLLLTLSRVSCKNFKDRREVGRKEKFFESNGGLLLLQQLSSPEVNVEKSRLFYSEGWKRLLTTSMKTGYSGRVVKELFKKAC